jgi:acyl carrier protein
VTDERSADLEARVTAVIVRALRLPGSEAAPLKMGSTPGWDSLGHMSVVVGLEKEFGVRFQPFRLPQLTDVPAIVRVLQS